MEAEPQKSIQIDESAHAVLTKTLGRNRSIKGSLSNLIRWACSQDRDIHSLLFDGISPEAELRILELLLDRAQGRARGSMKIAGAAKPDPDKRR